MLNKNKHTTRIGYFVLLVLTILITAISCQNAPHSVNLKFSTFWKSDGAKIINGNELGYMRLCYPGIVQKINEDRILNYYFSNKILNKKHHKKLIPSSGLLTTENIHREEEPFGITDKDKRHVMPYPGLFETIPREKLEESVLLACNWLVNIAQVQTVKPDKNVCEINYEYKNWQGAFKGEYKPGSKWSFFGTIWHTGQGVKALSLAYQYFRKPYLLESARLGAEFILNQQQTDKSDSDYGMILGYEDNAEWINTSCVLECCDGLFTLAKVTGEKRYAECAVNAVDWVVRRMYTGNGCFTDNYSSTKRKSHNPWPNRYNDPGRPLLDDGVLLKAWQHTGEEKFRNIFYEVANQLLKREEPEGNWIGYAPCHWEDGYLHPRQAFWWGRAMWMAYKDSLDPKYRDCFNRACRWYTKAMREDGGMIRNTYTDFNTECFGHVTSATSCAVMMFRDAYVELADPKYVSFIIKGLTYVMSMQVTQPQDPNMKGVIIEKCLPPNGTDSVPWAVRDIGTSFFITAATQLLLDTKIQRE